MPWLHKSKKASRVESGDCAAAKCGKIPRTSPQQQQPKRPQDELQSALHNVLEALQNLTEKRQQSEQRSPSPRQQQSVLQMSETLKEHQRRSCSQEKKKAKKKQQQQEPQPQPQQDPPQIFNTECDDAFRNLQLYLSRISTRCQGSPAGPVTASIVQSDSTFATDQLDPPSSASQLRRRNYRPTRRQLMPPEADLVSGLTSEDLQASEGSRHDDDGDEPKVNVVTERENASPTLVRRCCKSKVSELDITPERARTISSSLLQPPSTIALGCSIVTHYCGDCLSQHQHPTAVLLLYPATSTVRPPIKALNQQLPPCDEECSCSSRTKSLIIDEEVKVATVPNLATETCLVEAADKSINCSAVQCSTALNTCADGDSISDTSTASCSTAHAAAETANQDDSVDDNKSEDEDGEGGSKDEEVGNAVGVNSNNSVYRTGCCHRNHHRQPNPLQMHSVVESKLLERACESFPPAEEELAAPSSLNGIDWEPPRFSKVAMRLEQPRPAEPIGRVDNQGVSGGDSVGPDESGLRSSSSMRSATTLEVLDNVNDDVECDANAGVEANEDSSTAMSSCCTYDIGKSSGFTRLLLTLDRAHRRLEGLPPSTLPPPSGDTPENPALPAAQHQQHLNRQRASVQTLNKMLLRSPFVSRRERTPPPVEKHEPDNRHPVEQPAHPGCWTYQSMMHQQMTCQPMTSDQNRSELVSDNVIVTTATSLMTLSQSLQRCVLQLEAAVSRLNGNISG